MLRSLRLLQDVIGLIPAKYAQIENVAEGIIEELNKDLVSEDYDDEDNERLDGLSDKLESQLEALNEADDDEEIEDDDDGADDEFDGIEDEEDSEAVIEEYHEPDEEVKQD